jgi:hypothetical protein
MIPNEEQFQKVHKETMGNLDSTIKLTRGLADIFSNTSMSSSEKDAAIAALNKSVTASPSTTSTEHEYNEAMSQDPRYETPEAAEEKGNAMYKAEQEKK